MSDPRAWFRPRGEAYLQVWKGDELLELPLDEDTVDLPPQWDSRLAKPNVRAVVRRVPGGHVFMPTSGVAATANGMEIHRQHVLRGGDEIRFDRFFAVYTTAKEDLPWPMTLIVWPPEGPSVEIRTHRWRVDIGAQDGDLIIEDEYIDGLHCIIKRYRNGVMQIEDNGSYNGVYVDGVKVEDGMSLRDGAEIRIGNTRLKAWAEAPDVPDFENAPPVQDQYDLPDDGLDPSSDQPLKPYALELGPDFAERRRRTFDEDVPTKPDVEGEKVGVRARRRASDRDHYHDEDEGAEALPDWAPLDRNRPEAMSGKKRSRFQESETGSHWDRKDKGGITLVHEKNRPIAPRKGK